MVKRIYTLFFLICSLFVMSQPCNDQLINDSLYRPAENKKVAVSAMNCALENGGSIQFINSNGKYHLKIKPNQKIGFDDKGSLELMSGSKGFYIKSAQLYDHKLKEPYFIIDVQLNYVGQIKDEGMTGLVFNTFEVKFTKNDNRNIRSTAKCFYNLNNKK
jgi:hypothetical protein